MRAAGALSYLQTRVWVGERRVKALVVGVPDYANQQVDVVSVASGARPTAAGVLTDVQNAKRGSLHRQGGRHDPHRRDRRTHPDGACERRRPEPRGRPVRERRQPRRSLLDARPDLAARSRSGFSSLGFRLGDVSPAAADRTVARIEAYLRANTSFTGFSDLPEVRKAGSYPGKEFFDQIATLMNVFTILALLSALVLISNTMTTLIGEQRREIGMMKAIGGTRRQIRRIYLRTALLLGAIGSVIGVALGIVIANAIVRYFGSSFFAITPGFGIAVPVV